MPGRFFRVFSLFLGTLATLLWPLGADAQVLYGSLTGNVTDVSGAAVPGAKVEVVDVGTGVSRRTTTDDRGTFLIQDLSAGVYRVTIAAPAFANTVTSGVRVAENTVRRLDVRLQVATLGQSVTVSAGAETLQTDRADVNLQVTSSQIANLPISSTTRSFESIFKTLPGFIASGSGNVSASNPTQSLAFYVNGSTLTGNPVKLDGASDIYPWQPNSAAYIPPADAIETVNIATNSMDAEQGMAASSSINAIIKSGTNQFHGAAWEYNTNSAIAARNFFYAGAKNAKNILNQFGLDLGGPIKKDKLFFFADWERTEQRRSYSSLQTVAPNALRQVPEPNMPGGITNDYFAAADWQFRRDNIDTKINYNPTNKVTLFGRYSIAPSHIFDPQALGQAGGPGVDGGNPAMAPAEPRACPSAAPTALLPRC